MRVIFICDEGVALRERLMLHRLAVGLMEAGVRVVIAGAPSTDDTEDLVERVVVELPALRQTARRFARALCRRLAERGLSSDREPIDLIHAFGRRTWTIAGQVSEMLDAPIMVEAWSRSLVARAGKTFAPRRRHAGVVLALPSEGLRDPAELLAPTLERTVCRWGVHARGPRPAPSDALAPTAVLIANPSCMPEARVVFRALSQTAGVYDTHIVCDAVVGRRALRLWRDADEQGMPCRLSLVDTVEARRSAALNADVLIALLEPGEHRSILLDAMAASMLVMAPDNPACTWLRPDRTALIASGLADTHHWTTALACAFRRDRAGQTIVDNARRWVTAEHPVSRHVGDVVAAYQRLLGRVAAPIARPASK